MAQHPRAVGARAPDLVPQAVEDRAAASLLDVARRRPGWPLVLLFVGYPVWWALGIADLMTFVAAGAMAYELVRMRTIRVPPGFLVWVLFLVWVALGVVLVHIGVPGAVTGSSSTRYLTWAWRLMWYLKATIVLLYIGNQRHRLSLMWVCRVFSWMFVVIVAGGLLGVLAPHFEFRSAAELVLPRNFTSYLFVHSLVHPVAAESFAALGGATNRTSAPFPYSNVWGLNFACFLPFFMVAWFGPDAGWRRFVAPIVLALAIVPVVFSLNRGLWLALVVASLFVAVRSAAAGRVRLLVALMLGSLVLGLAVALSPLGHTIASRINGNGPTSNTGRDNLSSLGMSSMERTSPLLGFGTTRAVQGNFNSIAGGATPTCPRCSLPSLGTQGQVSLVTFTQGLGGAVLYFGFFILQFLRHIRLRSSYAVAALVVLLIHLVTSSVYSADNLALLAIFGALAMLWRAQVEVEHPPDSTHIYADREPTLHDYVVSLADHRKWLVVLVLGGALGGLFVSYEEGRSYSAAVSIVVAADPEYPTQLQPVTTLDTVAQSATSGATLDAIRRAIGSGHAVDPSRVSVTATPNTSVLHLTFLASSSASARSGVGAAARSVLLLRSVDLERQRHRAAAALQGRATAIRGSLSASAQTATSTSALQALTTTLLRQAADVNADLAQVDQLPTTPGNFVTPVSSHVVWDRWKVNVASGIALGILAGAAVSLAARLRTPRLGRRGNTAEVRGLRVLAEGPAASLDPRATLLLENAVACVGVGANRRALDLAASLDSRISTSDRLRTPQRVILVAGRGDRLGASLRARRILETSGAEVAGLVIVDGSARSRPSKTS